jgi:transcriptional regulator of acetoin/glycerol metabolism
VSALQVHHGNVRQVARALGMARGHVYRLLKKLNLDPAAFRPPGPEDA